MTRWNVYVWHDSSVRVCVMWRTGVFLCVTWLIDIDVSYINHPYVSSDSFICATRDSSSSTTHVFIPTGAYSELQRVAVRCSVLHMLHMCDMTYPTHVFILIRAEQSLNCVAVCCSVLHMCDMTYPTHVFIPTRAKKSLWYVAVRCSMLQCAAMRCICVTWLIQHMSWSRLKMRRAHNVLQCIAACCSVLHICGKTYSTGLVIPIRAKKSS